MGIIADTKKLFVDAFTTIKIAFDFEDTSKEMRLTVSIIVSLLFFFGFLALSGDMWSAAGLTAGLEIILLFVLSIF
jgi:hypothetical protein